MAAGDEAERKMLTVVVIMTIRFSGNLYFRTDRMGNRALSKNCKVQTTNYKKQKDDLRLGS